ncbi:MAG: DUF5678 domain-containing protein [Candidatus Bathyarchaeia archaeon]|jgi:hypothetical protein
MESTIELLSNLEGNARWISDNYEALKKRYNNEWVAVLDKSVIDHDRDFSKLVERLRTRFSEKYNEIALEYVTSEELNLIL